jgi:hypothetical protein
MPARQAVAQGKHGAASRKRRKKERGEERFASVERGDAVLHHSGRWRQNALSHLHCLLEPDFQCKRTLRRAFLHLHVLVALSLREGWHEALHGGRKERSDAGGAHHGLRLLPL